MKKSRLKSFFERSVSILTWVSRTIEAEIAEETARREMIMNEFAEAEKVRAKRAAATKAVSDSRNAVCLPTHAAAAC